MDFPELLVFGQSCIQESQSRLQVLILLIDVTDIHIEFGAEVQIFDILQDDIALHGQDAVEDIFDHLEGIVAFAEEGGDVSGVDNRVVGDIEELGAAVEGEGVDFGNDSLNIGDELEDSLGGIGP